MKDIAGTNRRKHPLRYPHQYPSNMTDVQGKVAPSKLGEYTVIRDIAEGTFGKVKSMYGSPLCVGQDGMTTNFYQWQNIPLRVIGLL